MWLSSTFIFYASIIGIVKSTVDYLQHPVKSCHVGDAVENECNKCLCTSKTVFECTPLDCKSNTTLNQLEETEPLCFPNQLYVQNLITCICTRDGRWPHKSCHETFQSLPPKNVITHKCTPNTYIPIDCNVCRCGPDGEILNDRCTRNACDDDVHRRNNPATNTVYSKCEEKYWYSLAPCQFCYCVNQNRLACNTGNYFTNNLDLGSYKLNTCGKELIKEAIELIPDNVKTLRNNSELTNTTTKQTNKVEPLTDSKSMEYDQDISTNVNIGIKAKPKENNDKNPRTQHIKIGMSSSSNEDYSNELEAKPNNIQKKLNLSKSVLASTTTVQTTIEVPSTQIPDQVDAEITDESEAKTMERTDVKTNEADDDESKGIEVEFEQSPGTPEIARTLPEEHAYQYDGNTLQIDVPKVLNKVFQMALRKSMVSLSKRTKCAPGSTTVHDCNMCFCLKNNKLLCTNHKCIGAKTF